MESNFAPTLDNQLQQMTTANTKALEGMNNNYAQQLERILAENREASRKQDEAHLARLEEDRRRAHEELERIRREQQQQEVERARRIEEDRQRQIQAQIAHEKRMAEESKARTGLLSSMKNAFDSVWNKKQTVTVVDVTDQQQITYPQASYNQQQQQQHRQPPMYNSPPQGAFGQRPQGNPVGQPQFSSSDASMNPQFGNPHSRDQNYTRNF